MKFDHPSKPFSARIAAFGSVVSVGLVSSSRVVASNKYVCINACLNLLQRYNLAWQQCDDSWARAVFKMAAFSNVPIVVMWTFVRNRMLPQIKQQQLEPYCNWYYYFFLFSCSILGLLSPWYQTTAKRTTWVSRVNILRVYSLRFT